MVQGSSSIFPMSGYVRRAGESDDSLNRLATKEGCEYAAGRQRQAVRRVCGTKMGGRFEKGEIERGNERGDTCQLQGESKMFCSLETTEGIAAGTGEEPQRWLHSPASITWTPLATVCD